MADVPKLPSVEEIQRSIENAHRARHPTHVDRSEFWRGMFVGLALGLSLALWWAHG